MRGPPRSEDEVPEEVLPLSHDLTPPRRARRRMAGLVMTWMLSRGTFLCLLAPLLPIPFPQLVTIETKNAVETRFGGNWVVVGEHLILDQLLILLTFT